MSAKFQMGDRVAIVKGRKGKGMRGEVFWIGDSRYGKGARYGVRGDDGDTYWVDEDYLGAHTDVPPPVLPDAVVLEKGARVRIVRGEHAGESGEVFWVGESKSGRGKRYGVRGDDDEETYWVDSIMVEEELGEKAEKRVRAEGEGPEKKKAKPAGDEPPLPTDDDAFFSDDDEGVPF